jgi:enoyl-CoA hydratase/carnithine racemase
MWLSTASVDEISRDAIMRASSAAPAWVSFLAWDVVIIRVASIMEMNLATDLRVDWWPERILVLTIDRPARRNVVDHALLEGIAAAIESNGREAGAIVLRGAGGKAFSAGFDINLLQGSDVDLEADRAIGTAVRAITASPAPVLSMIQGHCHGAGVELALSCDLRIAADDLQLSLQAVSLGVVYRYELVSRLVQLAGLGRATDLLLTMPRLDATTALEWGLITEVIPAADVEERTRAVALAIAAAPRSAMQGTKASLVMAARSLVLEDDLEKVAGWRRTAATSEERRAAIRAAKKRLGR